MRIGAMARNLISANGRNGVRSDYHPNTVQGWPRLLLAVPHPQALGLRGQCTVTVTERMVRPYWLVAYSL